MNRKSVINWLLKTVIDYTFTDICLFFTGFVVLARWTWDPTVPNWVIYAFSVITAICFMYEWRQNHRPGPE